MLKLLVTVANTMSLIMLVVLVLATAWKMFNSLRRIETASEPRLSVEKTEAGRWICPECGHVDTRDEALHCPWCGTKL